MDRGKEVTFRRMLERAPACRARSWAWPSDREADTRGCDDGDAAGAGAAVLSYPPALKPASVLSVRILRSQESFFMR